MATAPADEVVQYYMKAYQKLYNRTPRDLEVVNDDWVIVNGARMRVSELEYLTRQLQQEYAQGLEERRSVLKRLVAWFKGT
jgi:hypothetical protein